MFTHLTSIFFNSHRIPFFTTQSVALSLIALFSTSMSFAQEDKEDIGTEVVNIVKPYTPTISDAFKVKQTPVLNDSITTAKRPVQYSIFSVPVASTFTPAKGKAATVEKAKRIKLYDNYATLGFGNYTTILGELYSNFEISRTDNAGFFFRHNSSQGDIDDVRLENKYYDTRLDGHYTSRQREATYHLNAGVQHQLYNWYGLPQFYETFTNDFVAGIDPQQTYLSGYLGGSMGFDDSFFEGVDAEVRFLADAFDSSEFNVKAKPEFAFNLEDFSLTLKGELDFLSGSFDQQYQNNNEGIEYSYLNAGITPALSFINNDLSVSLGVSAYVSLDNENSETDLNIYPALNASYRLVDEFLIAYAGADGGLEQNSYYNFKEENPFVSPTLFIAPTSHLYNGFAGLKGKLSNTVAYNLRGSYGKDEDRGLYLSNTVLEMGSNLEPYEYGNSFGIVYDDITTLSVFGELKVDFSEAFTLGVNGTYYSYDTNNESQAWNLPDYEATVFTNFSITEELYGGASVFFVGERNDQETFQLLDVAQPLLTEVTLDSYIDANVHLGYRINEQLSFFAKGSNLLGNNYEKWYNFPVQGIQGLLGATYKFDW